MKRFLAVSVLVMGLSVYGCGDDDDGGSPDAAAGGSGGSATGGSGGARTGGSGGTAAGGSGGTAAGGSGGTAAGGSGGSSTDARPADSGTTGDTRPADGGGTTGDGGSGDAASANIWASCMDPKPGVSATDFCAYYAEKCMYGDGANKFGNMGACVTRYNGYNNTQKGCAAYHLCVAGTSSAMATVHCPHPAQVGGPCMLP